MKNKFFSNLVLAAMATQFTACAQKDNFANSKTYNVMNNAPHATAAKQVDTATFGAGCFWCTEAQFRQLNGVIDVQSGYSGGHVHNPSYHDVCGGNTGHAEVCNIYYDPSIITFDELLAAFWTCHDPTTLNRQGHDVGTQYRSVIFYHNPEQMQKAKEYKDKLNLEKAFSSDIVTAIDPFTGFYVAENYHQDYYAQNGSQPYCSMVIQPKLEKFRKVFKDKLKASH
jgi:peptide-methionine (S)-S-oxide reductase